jgi:predicted adenylyl cyclase CyaB
MPHLNIEIKARCADLEAVRALLEAHAARFVDEDHQVDTYFHVPQGRLKLREGMVEHALIYYEREDAAGPKRSDVYLYHPTPDPALKSLLTAALGIRQIVDKRRDIFFIDNVKFHLDRVAHLGTFVEIEAIDQDGTLGAAYLHTQCAHYQHLFGITDADLLTHSYSDLLTADASRIERS